MAEAFIFMGQLLVWVGVDRRSLGSYEKIPRWQIREICKKTGGFLKHGTGRGEPTQLIVLAEIDSLLCLRYTTPRSQMGRQLTTLKTLTSCPHPYGDDVVHMFPRALIATRATLTLSSWQEKKRKKKRKPLCLGLFCEVHPLGRFFVAPSASSPLLRCTTHEWPFITRS